MKLKDGEQANESSLSRVEDYLLPTSDFLNNQNQKSMYDHMNTVFPKNECNVFRKQVVIWSKTIYLSISLMVGSSAVPAMCAAILRDYL